MSKRHRVTPKRKAETPASDDDVQDLTGPPHAVDVSTKPPKPPAAAAAAAAAVTAAAAAAADAAAAEDVAEVDMANAVPVAAANAGHGTGSDQALESAGSSSVAGTATPASSPPPPPPPARAVSRGRDVHVKEEGKESKYGGGPVVITTAAEVAQSAKAKMADLMFEVDESEGELKRIAMEHKAHEQTFEKKRQELAARSAGLVSKVRNTQAHMAIIKSAVSSGDASQMKAAISADVHMISARVAADAHLTPSRQLQFGDHLNAGAAGASGSSASASAARSNVSPMHLTSPVKVRRADPDRYLKWVVANKGAVEWSDRSSQFGENQCRGCGEKNSTHWANDARAVDVNPGDPHPDNDNTKTQWEWVCPRTRAIIPPPVSAS